MKKLTLILLCLLPALGFGQDRGTWSVSTSFQTDHNFIEMNTNDIYYVHLPDIYIKPAFQFTSGVNVNYRFPFNLELSSGLRFSQKNQDLVGWAYLWGCGNVSYLFDYSYAPMTRQFVEMPILARYYFLPGKIKMHVESGWIGSYRLDKTPSLATAGWVLGSQTGIGVNYFMDRWQIGVGANYRYQMQLGDRDLLYRLNRHAFGFEIKTAFTINN